MLGEIHNHASHFSSKVVLDHLKIRVFWPKMVFDVHKYIQGCLSYAKWATAV